MKKNYPLENISLVQGKIDNDGKISDGHIIMKDHMACEKIWDKFGKKNMGDYHDHYFKKSRIIINRCIRKIYWYLLKIL